MRRCFILVILLFAAGVAFAACEKKEPYVESPQLLVGQPLPKVRIQRIDVGPTNLKTTRGRPAVLALWASWCEPCAREIPTLLRWQATRPDVDLIVLNVDSMDTDLNIIRRLAGDWGVGAPLLATTPARAGALGMRSLPVAYAIGADGVVLGVSEGFKGEEVLLGWLSETLPPAP